MPKAAVVVYPGSNCDYDTLWVLKEVVGVDAELVWHETKDLSPYSLVVLPGGFSYGDYLRAGAIARFSPATEALLEYAEKERGLVLGICNGFQVLTEAGLLPGALAKNTSRRFICRFVRLVVENAETPFTRLYEEGEEIELPIAHSEGRFYLPKGELESLEARRGVAFRYVENPNGSLNSIAGIVNERWNVLGMMPHPERNSEEVLGDASGRRLFLSIKREIGA